MKTNEIVKRAQQIADLENSSFISWAENVNLLNEAYRDIFQKAINANVKYWLKDWVLKDGESIGENATRYKLPSDFYTLYSINEKGTNRNLFKKSTNETTDGFKYDIENGYLIVYGAMRKDIVAKYYKAPEKLYYKGEEIETGADLSNVGMTSTCDNLIVWYNHGNNKAVIYDIKTETKKEITLTVTYDSCFCFEACKNGLVFLVIESGDKKIKVYDYSGNEIQNETIFQNHEYFFIDDKKRFLKYNSTTHALMQRNSLVKFIELPIDFDGLLNTSGFIDWETKKAYWVDTLDTVTEYDLQTKEKTEYVQGMNNLTLAQIFDKWLFIRDSDYYMAIPIKFNGDGGEGFSLLGFNKKDYKTSYGYVDDKGVLQSIFDDVEIDTPNSFFDAMLSYSLALQYKAKQNAINEGLVTLYQNAENQFFNSIPQDTFSNSRIQNVY